MFQSAFGVSGGGREAQSTDQNLHKSSSSWFTLTRLMRVCREGKVSELLFIADKVQYLLLQLQQHDAIPGRKKMRFGD